MTFRIARSLRRIADALERVLLPQSDHIRFDHPDAFVWHGSPERFEPVPHVNRVPVGLLKGISRQRDLLTENTRRFAKALPANNALLWGARGMGKSSLIKAVHAAANDESSTGARLKLIEIHREDIQSLPRCLALLGKASDRFILFCDDLSFETEDTSYKSLKAVLEGGIEGRSDNVVLYATSNRRHLMPRSMMDNESADAINPGEAIEEKVSLSDRFGLWIGFHACTQDDYLEMVHAYADHFGLDHPVERLDAEALEWSRTRGARSGRVAWQFTQDLAGRIGKRLDLAQPG